jgi:folate-dependent phosphoribosylglycinamide formyltransferase PurN
VNIGVFVYDFPHQKSAEGLMRLISERYKPLCALSAPKKQLTFYSSHKRLGLQGIEHLHPKDICYNADIPYHVVEHNSDITANLIKTYNLDIGIILGSRILSNKIIKSFNKGVINMHPGVLPHNRGLDNILWAVHDNLPQGITTHFIDKYIDKGSLISRKTIQVYNDDTWQDITMRLHYLQMHSMIEALNRLSNGEAFYINFGDGKYNNGMPIEIEEKIEDMFINYKNNYDKILSEFSKYDDTF